MKAIKPLYFLILSLFIVGCTKEDHIPTANTEEDHKLALEEIVNTFQDKTGIIIWYEPSTDQKQNEIQLSHGIKDEDYFDERKKYQKLRYRMPELIEKINSYPKAFLDEVDVRYIIIVKSSMLSYAGRASGFSRSIVLNWTYSWKNTLSHELFHLFDPAPAYSSWTEDQQQFDLEWQLLNPPNFTYGEGCGKNNSISTYTEGFITEYCRCNSNEDRAVTFQMLLHKNEIVEEIIKTDIFLNSKVHFIKNLVNPFRAIEYQI